MGIFKYLYQGYNPDILTSGYVVTEFMMPDCYIIIIQDGMGNVVESAQKIF